MGVPRIQAVGTAVPTYVLKQGEIKQFVATLFHSHMDHLERLLPIFENSLIHIRHLSKPLEWYSKAHSFAEANTIFEQVALELSEKAAVEAMKKANVQAGEIEMIKFFFYKKNEKKHRENSLKKELKLTKPNSPNLLTKTRLRKDCDCFVQAEEIEMIIFVSSTGITTPTLDAKLIERLGLSPHTRRLPIWGLGCAGGVAGMARAAELAHSVRGKSILLVTVELCSLTFQQHDYSKSNLVGTSLFADGAAAVLIKIDGEGPSILGNYSNLFPDSAHIMGWDLVDTGFKVRFSRDIPSLVKNDLPGVMQSACDQWGIHQTKICHYIVHPGGAKVVSAYQQSLGLGDDTFTYAYEILASYGNMSSVTVLFVLEKFIKETPPTGAYGIMLALGPGFSAEQVLFQW